MKIRSVRDELFYADWPADTRRHDEANSRFLRFCERAKSG